MGCLVLLYTSRVISKGRLTMEEIIFSLKHYCALWTAKLLNSQHFRGWTSKPHEHKPNSESGKASSL